MTLTQIEKYRYKKYHKDYLKIFKKEKDILDNIKNIKIEHIADQLNSSVAFSCSANSPPTKNNRKTKLEDYIGSTAVKGLGGKGVIDIMIGVKKDNMRNVSREIQKKGAILIHKEKNRWFFEKDSNYKFVKRIHIQLVSFNCVMWKNTILFRDYLIKNRKARSEYSKIKKTASKLANGDGVLYRKHKNSFINKILKINGEIK